MNKVYRHLEHRFPLLHQLFRFGVIGLTAAFIQIGVVVALVQGFAMAPLSANVVGFLIAFQMSYWGHRLWTFKASYILHAIAIPKLLLVQLINFAANETLFYLFLSLHLPYPIALAIVLTILPIFTYFSSKLWVFR